MARPEVEFSGKWHNIPDAGINPLPVQRPIPVWFGGGIKFVASRIAQYGDGWIPLNQVPGPKAKDAFAQLRDAVRSPGREPDAVGIDVWVSMGAGTPAE